MKLQSLLDRALVVFGLVRRDAIVGESYHDVEVVVNGRVYPFQFGDYGLELTCTRAGGWTLWHRWQGKEKKIGGEYNNDYFKTTVNGRVICLSEPEDDANDTETKA